MSLLKQSSSLNSRFSTNSSTILQQNASIMYSQPQQQQEQYPKIQVLGPDEDGDEDDYFRDKEYIGETLTLECINESPCPPSRYRHRQESLVAVAGAGRGSALPQNGFGGKYLTCSPQDKAKPKISRPGWNSNTNPATRQLELHDHSLIRTARHVLRQRAHAFSGIWDKNDFISSQDPRLQCHNMNNNSYSIPPIPCSIGLNWKQWPPQLPNVPDGLKIPIEFDEQIDGKFRQNFGLEARPISECSDELFSRQKGILNRPKATSCTVSPTSILFLQAQVGQRYTATIKIQNKGSIPRKIGFLRPSHKYFDVRWGIEIGNGTDKSSKSKSSQGMIPPGLAEKIIVEFKPKSTEIINDVLTIIVHGDGNIVVPILTKNISPPVLEVDEWDCGCSIINQTRFSDFEICNYGGEGRFWLLTENEFNKEYLNVHKSNKHHDQKGIEELDGIVELEKLKKYMYPTSETEPKEIEIETIHPPKKHDVDNDKETTKKDKNPFKMDHLYKKPFKISPCCFHLPKNSKISLKTRYRPTSLGFHYEKIAILCDNDEVRWIVIKGVGIDGEAQPIVNLEGEWTGPPCDLPTDIATKFTIDVGDLVADEIGKPKLKLINTSCIPVYFFWSIRPLHTTDSPILQTKNINKDDDDFDDIDDLTLDSFKESSSFEWKDHYYANSSTNGGILSVCPMSVQISPAQGILEGFSELESFCLVESPKIKLKYHSCVISLFVQQLEDVTIKSLLQHKLSKLSKSHPEFIDIPILFTQVMLEMPSSNTYDSASSSEVESDSEDEEKAFTTLEENEEIMAQKVKKDKNAISLLPVPLLVMKLDPHSPSTNNNAFYLSQLRHPYDHRFYNVKNMSRRSRKRRNQQPKTKESLLTKKSTSSQIKVVQDPDGEDPWIPPTPQNDDDDDDDKNLANTVNEAGFLKINCLEDCLINKEKSWLQSNSFLRPSCEIEIWARSIPLEIWFEPSILVGTGAPGDEIERNFVCFNDTLHLIEIQWDDVPLNEFCGITMNPMKFQVQPGEGFQFKIVTNLFNYGNFCGDLSGQIKLPFKTINCKIPANFDISGASIETLTPVVHFGLAQLETEKIRTIGLKNPGNQRITWRAQLSETELVTDNDGTLHSMSLNQKQIHSKQMLKIWPEWGSLEGGEVAGVQLYLYSEIIGKIATTVEIKVDHASNTSNSTLYIPVYAEFQSPYLILKNAIFELQNLFVSTPSRCSCITLFNPTNFFVSFAWREPIGSDTSLVQLQFEPNKGIIAPTTSMTCELIIIAFQQAKLNNLFVPCCVEGMKEPLLLQINGTVHGISIDYILPPTKRSLLRQDQYGLTMTNSMTDAKLEYLLQSEEEAKRQVGRLSKIQAGEDEEAEILGESRRRIKHIINEQEGEKSPTKIHPADVDADNYETMTDDENEVQLQTKTKKRKSIKAKPRKSQQKLNKNSKDKQDSLDPSDPSTADTNSNSKDQVVKRKSIGRKSITKKKSLKKGRKNKNKNNNIQLQKRYVDERFGEAFGESRNIIKLLPPEDHNMLKPEAEEGPPPHCLTPESPENTIYFEVSNVGQIVHEYFFVRNNSPVSASFSFEVKHFAVQSWINTNKTNIVNYIARKMYSESPSDIENRILRGNHGIAFEIYPKHGILLPFQIIKVDIHVHSNSWGNYKDELICQVEGISEPHIIYLEALVTGCPNTLQEISPPKSFSPPQRNSPTHHSHHKHAKGTTHEAKEKLKNFPIQI